MDINAVVKVIRPLNIRSGGPNTTQPIARRVEVGAHLVAAQLVEGEFFKGESNWYREKDTDYYFWSGAVSVLDSTNTPIARSEKKPEPLLGNMLTTHFSLDEFTASQTASRIGIDNTPSPEIVANLRQVAESLEIVRAFLGNVPISISSGYRCSALNKQIGGAVNSAHVSGLAVDFTAPTFGTVRQTAIAISQLRNFSFDKLIYEYGRWVHLGFAPVGGNNRREILSYFGKTYTSGIAESTA